VKIYTTVEPVPSRVRGVVRLLAVDKKGRLQREALMLLQPASLRDKDSDPAIALKTIEAAIEMGAIHATLQDGEKLLRLSEEASELSDAETFDAAWPAVIARLVLRPEIHGQPNAFARLCAWFMSQHAMGMPEDHGGYKARMLAHGLSIEEFGLQNDARLDMVIYWVKHVGLLWQTQKEKCKGMIPDATVYVERHLNELLPRSFWAIHRMPEPGGCRECGSKSRLRSTE